jgi:hypothetical protein
LVHTVAIVLVMAPAPLHRQTEPMAVAKRVITISSRLLMASMAPLAIGICLDVYLVARVIAGCCFRERPGAGLALNEREQERASASEPRQAETRMRAARSSA